MPSKTLMVFIGAGASFDCVDEEGITDFNTQYRPPLTEDVLGYRQSFNSILRKYPAVESLSDEWRTKLRGGKSIEALLRGLELDSQKYPFMEKQFLQFPLYLQELFSEISEHFIVSGSTKFETLLHYLLRSSYDEFILVTTNYDLFIENAIQKVLGYKFENLDSYIKDKRWKLIKLHGSVNWGTKITNSPVVRYYSIVQYLESLEYKIRWGVGVKIVGDYRNRFENGHYFYPAIAIPIEGKKDFICPLEHFQTYGEYLRQATDFLVIGFSARDLSILEQFRLVRDVNKFKVINGSKISGIETFDRITKVNDKFKVPGQNPDSLVYEGGFNDFIGTGALEEILTS